MAMASRVGLFHVSYLDFLVQSDVDYIKQQTKYKNIQMSTRPQKSSAGRQNSTPTDRNYVTRRLW